MTEQPLSPGDVDCDAALAALFGYLDGALSSPDQQMVGTHLNRCPPCHGAFDFQSGLRSVLQQRCQSELPAGFLDRLRGQLNDDSSILGPDSGLGR